MLTYYQKAILSYTDWALKKFRSLLEPDFYLDTLDYVYQGADVDYLLDCLDDRYWLLSQKLCAGIILKLKDYGLLPSDAPDLVLSNTIYMPAPNDPWNLIDTTDNIPIGIGLPGTGELQEYLYRIAGWECGERQLHYDSWQDIYHDPDLLTYIQDTFPRNCWSRVFGLIQETLSYYGGDSDFCFLYLRYRDQAPSYIRKHYVNLLGDFSCKMLNEERYLIYLCPTYRFPTVGLLCETDFSSLNMYGAFLALKDSLAEPLGLPCVKQ